MLPVKLWSNEVSAVCILCNRMNILITRGVKSNRKELYGVKITEYITDG